MSINTGLVTVETGKPVVLPKLMYNGKALNNKEYDYKNAKIKDSNGNTVTEIRTKGSYTVTYKALDVNFTGTVTSNVKVLSAGEVSNMTNISKLKTEKIANVVYNGDAHTPVVRFKNGKTASEVCDVQYVDNTDAGTASIILTGDIEKKYYGTKTITFKIVAKSLNLNDYSITARYNGDNIVYDKEHKMYDKKELSSNNGTSVSLNSVQVWVGEAGRGVSLREGIDYTIKYSGVKKAGTASLIIKGIGNYKGSMKGSFKIGAYDITSAKDITVQISDQPYAKNFKTPTIILKRGDIVISPDNYTVKCTSKVVGDSFATVTGRNLLKGKIRKKFKIVEKDMSAVTISAPNIYNGGSIKAKGDKMPYITKIAILDNNKKMVLNKDYTLAYYKADQFDETLFDGTNGDAYYRNAETGEKIKGKPLGEKEKINFTGENQTIYVVAKAVSGSGYKGVTYESYSLVSKNMLNRLKVEKLDTPIAYTEGETANVLISKIMQKYVDEGKLKIQNKKFSDNGKYVTEDSLTSLTAKDFEIDYSRSKYKNGRATIVINGKGDYAGTKKISVRVEPFDLNSWGK